MLAKVKKTVETSRAHTVEEVKLGNHNLYYKGWTPSIFDHHLNMLLGQCGK